MRQVQRLFRIASHQASPRQLYSRSFNTLFNPLAARTAIPWQYGPRSHSTDAAIKATWPKSTPSKPLPHKPAPHRNPEEPIYQLTFTCKPCGNRSSHTISKQGYHKGTVLITCPDCKNRHLIADHLHIFSDQSTTVEDIMKQKGEEVQRGSISPEGDVEFWGAEDVDEAATDEAAQPTLKEK